MKCKIQNVIFHFRVYKSKCKLHTELYNPKYLWIAREYLEFYNIWSEERKYGGADRNSHSLIQPNFVFSSKPNGFSAVRFFKLLIFYQKK